jgi:hypothetical protein
MRTARVPDDSLPPLTRSVAACLAAILELDTEEVPLPDAAHPEPWTAWRVWLARLGLGLVPVERPREFAWPGPWLALLRDGTAAVAYGSPPGGLAWAPLGGSFEDIEGGYAIAPHHVALWAPNPTTDRRTDGRVEALAIAAAAVTADCQKCNRRSLEAECPGSDWRPARTDRGNGSGGGRTPRPRLPHGR